MLTIKVNTAKSLKVNPEDYVDKRCMCQRQLKSSSFIEKKKALFLLELPTVLFLFGTVLLSNIQEIVYYLMTNYQSKQSV